MKPAPAPRQFEDAPAVRERIPLGFALVGASGSGKSLSALRLAEGIRRVAGGEVFVIDTEADRAKLYAPKKGERANPPHTFDFRHVPMGAPFSSLDYLAAIEHCYSKKATVIVIDSMSHEHESTGGMLERIEATAVKLGEQWRCGRDAAIMAAHAREKPQRRTMLNRMMQMRCNFILCFRAKEKVKPAAKGAADREPVKMGWMPIAGEEIVYEMTLRAMLPPGADGVAKWETKMPGEEIITKIPEMFRPLFAQPRQFDEAMGEQLARWAAGEGSAAAPSGGAAPPRADLATTLAACTDVGAWLAENADEIGKLNQKSRAAADKMIAKRRAALADRPRDVDSTAIGGPPDEEGYSPQ